MTTSHHQHLSSLLEEYVKGLNQEQVSIGDIVHLLGYRSIGGLLLLFALPVALPIPMPGLSAVFGLFLVFFSIQLAIGLKHIWMPKFLSRPCISRSRFERLVAAVVPVLRRMEKLVYPRVAFLTQDWVKMIVGILCIILSLVVMLPIPFGNVVPSFAIALFALALIQHDGLIIAMGMGVTFLALALSVMATIGLSRLF